MGKPVKINDSVVVHRAGDSSAVNMERRTKARVVGGDGGGEAGGEDRDGRGSASWLEELIR